MEYKILGKVLGIAGLVIVAKGQVALLTGPKAQLNTRTITFIVEEGSNPVEKAFDFSGIPQVVVSGATSTSSIAAGISFNILPSVVDLG